MTPDQFNDILQAQLATCQEVLTTKAGEYASSYDRLHNFKLAAALTDQTPAQALAGMMAKHTISVYDMIDSGLEYPQELWDEKITDHMNYLILLKAIVAEKDIRIRSALDHSDDEDENE